MLSLTRLVSEMISVFSNEKKNWNQWCIHSVQRQWIIKYGTHYNMTSQFFGDLTIKTRALVWKKSLDLLWPPCFMILTKIRKHADTRLLMDSHQSRNFKVTTLCLAENSIPSYFVPALSSSSRANVFEKFPFKWTLQLSSQNWRSNDYILWAVSSQRSIGRALLSYTQKLHVKGYNRLGSRLPLKFNNRAGAGKLKTAVQFSFEKLHTFSRYKVNRISLRWCLLAGKMAVSRGANDRLLRSVDFCIH